MVLETDSTNRSTGRAQVDSPRASNRLAALVSKSTFRRAAMPPSAPVPVSESKLQPQTPDESAAKVAVKDARFPEFDIRRYGAIGDYDASRERDGTTPRAAHNHLGLGKLYARTGKREPAHEHLTTATTMYRELGTTYWLEKAEAEMKLT